MERQKLVIGGRRREAVGIEFLPVSVAAALDGLAAAGLLDEDAPDRLGGGGEEMACSLESLVADKPEERLVHQRRRVERLPGLLAGESSPPRACAARRRPWARDRPPPGDRPGSPLRAVV